MKKRTVLGTALFFLALSFLLPTGGLAFKEHLTDLDAVRTSLTSVGGRLPDIIKKAKPEDIRTLERVFEINNYALVTIESYLKMLKVMISSGGSLNKDTIGVLNNWLKFIKNYCEYDLKYFEEALSGTRDEVVIEMLNIEKQNISMLIKISEKGIDENNRFVTKLQ